VHAGMPKVGRPEPGTRPDSRLVRNTRRSITRFAGMAGGGAITLALALFAGATAAFAQVQWTANGVPVVDLTSTTTVKDVATAPDGAGGVYVAWADDRTGNFDIYLTRFSSSGTLVSPWPNQGLAVCTATGGQSVPVLAADNAGGVYVAWQDARAGANLEVVYIARFASNSATAANWPVGGQVAGGYGGMLWDVAMTVDGTSSVFLAWQDHAVWNNYRIFAQKVAAANAALAWGTAGTLIAEGVWDDFHTQLVPDGAGGMVAAWTTGSVQIQRYASSNGAPMWSTWPGWNGVNVASSAYRPQLVKGGTGELYVGYDRYTAYPDEYDAHVDVYNFDGNAVAWPIAFTGPANADFRVRMAPDGVGGAVVAWQRFASGAGTGSIRMTRLSGQAVAGCMASGGVELVAGISGSLGLDEDDWGVTGDGRGGGFAAWTDGYVHARHLGVNGTLDPAYDLVGSPTPGYRYGLSATAADAGSLIAAWVDPRSGFQKAAYAQRLAASVPSIPAGLSTLAVPLAGSMGVDVAWTVPATHPVYGDPVKFDLRYSLGGITEANFYSASSAGVHDAAGGPGTDQCVAVAPLTRCRVYTFAVKAYYACGVWSTISNTPTAATRCSGYTITDCAGFYSLADLGAEESLSPGELSFAVEGREAGRVRFGFGVPEASRGLPIDVGVFDVAGRRLATLVSGSAEPGYHAASWDLRSDDGTPVPRGVVFARVRVGGESRSRTVIVNR
jgi:hypothetical protein